MGYLRGLYLNPQCRLKTHSKRVAHRERRIALKCPEISDCTLFMMKPAKTISVLRIGMFGQA